MGYKSLFHTVFERWPNAREIKVMQRLHNLYGETITKGAIKLSCIVTNGTPVNYMNRAAYGLSEQTEYNYDLLGNETQKLLKEMRKMGQII